MHFKWLRDFWGRRPTVRLSRSRPNEACRGLENVDVEVGLVAKAPRAFWKKSRVINELWDLFHTCRHLAYRTIKQALDNGIIFIYFSTNTNHVLQLLGAGISHDWSIHGEKNLKKFYKAIKTIVVLRKYPKLLKFWKVKQMFKTLKGEHIVKCFKGSGLYNLYNVNKSVVKNRNILTGKGTGDATQLSISNTL